MQHKDSLCDRSQIDTEELIIQSYQSTYTKRVYRERKTQQWLSQPNLVREFLGQELRRLAYTSTGKRALQAITHSYPTQTALVMWGKQKDPTCQLCGLGEPESLAHLQCVCPATKEARIAAHHAVWRGLVQEIRAHTPAKQSVVLTEVTLASLAKLGEALPVQGAARGQ